MAPDVVQLWFSFMCGLMFYSSDGVNLWGGRMLVNCKVNHGGSDLALIELSWFMLSSYGSGCCSVMVVCVVSLYLGIRWFRVG